MQIVIAGKAHPQDIPGKTLIREIVQLLARSGTCRATSSSWRTTASQVARELVRGVDLWLNTPRRGEEACGTSGMKAGINGVLNLSILDGWFDEAAEDSGGWAIGDREPIRRIATMRTRPASTRCSRTRSCRCTTKARPGRAEEWMRRVKQSLRYLSAQFNCQRMVEEYRTQLYEPAHRAWEVMSAEQFPARRSPSGTARGPAVAAGPFPGRQRSAG